MIVLGIALGVVGYAYLGYPLLLLLLTRSHRRGYPTLPPSTWPSVTVSLPVYNGAGTIGEALDAIFANAYPGELQVLVLSDGSTDATDPIVTSFAPRGVELFALPTRVGKTEAENRSLGRIRGEIVISTDASVRLHPFAITSLVAAMADPTIGVASGRDVSVDPREGANGGETAYVGYEMWLRDLETAAGGIVGASGCLYAVRTVLHRRHLPPHLSRDFAAALHARAQHYRAVSVPAARCFVARTRGGIREYKRKVRTMARGLATLGYHRGLLDPFRYGRFAWMLWSHKLVRWLTPIAAAISILALVLPGTGTPWARALVAVGALFALCGWWWPGETVPQVLTFPAYAAGAVLAGLHAWGQALSGGALPVWEPTRRGVTTRPGDRA